MKIKFILIFSKRMNERIVLLALIRRPGWYLNFLVILKGIQILLELPFLPKVLFSLSASFMAHRPSDHECLMTQSCKSL